MFNTIYFTGFHEIVNLTQNNMSFNTNQIYKN